MKTQALGSLLGAAALAGVVYLAFQLESLGDRLDALSRREGARVALEAPLSRSPEGGGAAPALPREFAAPDAALETSRLAEVERRLVELESRTPPMAPAVPGVRLPRFVGSAEELASDLGLTRTQKDRVAAAVERGRERIEEILGIPDESGKSPLERRREAEASLRGEITSGGGAGAVFALGEALLGWRAKPIPGRGTTYGAEVDRVERETREEIERSLDEKQRERFADVPLGPLLHGGGDVAFSVTLASGGESNGDAK